MKRMNVAFAAAAIAIISWVPVFAQAHLTSALTPQAQASDANESLRDTIISVMEEAATRFDVQIDPSNLAFVSRDDLFIISVATIPAEMSTPVSAVASQPVDVGLVYVSHATRDWTDHNTSDPGILSSAPRGEDVPAGFYALKLVTDGSSSKMTVYDDLGRVVVRFPVTLTSPARSSEVAASLDSGSLSNEATGYLAWYGPQFSVAICMMFAL